MAHVEPLIETYGVDILLAGHNHVYERSKPMRSGEPTTAEMHEYGADREGYIEVISGGGGARLYDFVPPDQFHSWSASYARRHHLMVIDVAPGSMRVQALLTDGPPDQPLEVFDEFTLVGARRQG